MAAMKAKEQKPVAFEEKKVQRLALKNLEYASDTASGSGTAPPRRGYLDNARKRLLGVHLDCPRYDSEALNILLVYLSQIPSKWSLGCCDKYSNISCSRCTIRA